MTSTFCEVFPRLLTIARQRRSVIGLLAVGAALVHPQLALACKKVGKTCDKDGDCCDGAKCKNKTCRCKSGYTKCDKRCYDLDNDEQHCGTCGNACKTGETCCTFSRSEQEPRCFDLSSDTTACGTTCDTAVNCLNTDQICVAGACVDP